DFGTQSVSKNTWRDALRRIPDCLELSWGVPRGRLFLQQLQVTATNVVNDNREQWLFVPVEFAEVMREVSRRCRFGMRLRVRSAGCCASIEKQKVDSHGWRNIGICERASK